MFGISDASLEKMSMPHNHLIMEEKLAALPPKGNENFFWLEIWGKSHKELRVDTQFVRFPPRGCLCPMTLNNICADRKELKMLTKGPVRKNVS